MAKIIINSSVISSNDKEKLNDIKAILKDNKITYSINETKVSILIKDNMVTLKRENSEIKISLEFNKSKKMYGIYYIKPLNIKLKVTVETKKLIITNNSLSVNYDLYINDEFSDNFNYNIEWRCL